MSGTSPHMQTLVFLSPTGAVVHMREIVIIRVYFFTPRYLFIRCAPEEIALFDRFSCFMAQKTCFSDSYVLSGVRTKFLNNFHYFLQKKRNSLFLQCKISIGNNSGSIKDRVVKFAYSMGFSAIAHRTVWLPSLSRDQKWPRPPIRRKERFECV